MRNTNGTDAYETLHNYDATVLFFLSRFLVFISLDAEKSGFKIFCFVFSVSYANALEHGECVDGQVEAH